MNVLSLFDGMSGGQMALNKLNIKIDNYYASEIKEDAISITQENFPNTIQLGDVRNIKSDDLPKIDLLLAGSPCQNFSIAAPTHTRNGLDGEKSGLFYEFYRLFKTIKFTHYLLENVGSMKKSDQDIISELLGVEPIKINSKLVSGQLRNRLYWTNIPNIEQPSDKGILLNDVLDYGWSDREKARCLLEGDSRPNTTPVKMFHRYYSTGFTTLIFESEEHYNTCKHHYDNNFSGMSAKEIDITIKESDIDLSVYDRVRYLNQNELEKLQTVPSGYTSTLTRNQAAGLLGDGWTIDVIAHILSHMN